MIELLDEEVWVTPYGDLLTLPSLKTARARSHVYGAAYVHTNCIHRATLLIAGCELLGLL